MTATSFDENMDQLHGEHLTAEELVMTATGCKVLVTTMIKLHILKSGPYMINGIAAINERFSAMIISTLESYVNIVH